MALFFAAGRWGCGSGIYDYAAMARRILHSCLHKGEKPARAADVGPREPPYQIYHRV